MIPREEIQKIIDSVDIVELVKSEGISLEKVGRNYRGLCPFHDDSNPSFYVNQEKKIAHCMSCKGGGNPINFIKTLHNFSIEESCQYIADKIGLKLNFTNINKKESIYQKHYKIMQSCQEFYEYYLKNTVSGDDALKYLYNRRLSDETIKSFHIGLAPKKIDILYKTINDGEDNTMELLETGMIKKGQNGYYDMFVNRIMFPIWDEQGQVVAFSGRVYDVKSDSKYVNSPETLIFKKSNVLYNLNNASKAIKKNNRIILFEGFMDVIAAYNAGIKEGVCSMGTSLTLEQADLIAKYTKNVIICYDGDNAGITATNRAIDILSSKGLRIGIVMLKEGLDPDEYAAKYGNGALSKVFDEEVIDIYGFRYQYLLRDTNFNNFLMVEDFKTKIFKMLYKVKSDTLNDIYFQKLAKDLNVNIDAIRTDYINYFRLTPTKKNVEKIEEHKKISTKVDNKFCLAERILLRYMLDSSADAYYIESYLQEIMGDLCFNPIALEIRILLVGDYFENNPVFDYETFKLLLSNEAQEFMEKKILSISISKGDLKDKEIKDCIETIREYETKAKIEELKNKAINTSSIEEKNALYQEIFKLKNKVKVE